MHMPLYIKDPDVDKLVDRYLAASGARNKTEAVRTALLNSIAALEKQETLAERVAKVQRKAAEAGLKIGGEQATKGMEYLNDVITNRTTNTAMKVNAAADFTLERILKERRKELVGEGLAVYDYTRNKLPVVRKGSWHLTSLETSNAYTIQPNDSRLAIPIPQTEIDANPNLVQNP